MSGAWSAAENVAVIALYDAMHIRAWQGEAYNKAAMIREASGKIDKFHTCNAPLMLRSKGSIEMKLMNVTAACEALGRKDLSMAEHGFRPMPNMQKALKDAVEVWLAFEPPRDSGDSAGNAYVTQANDPMQQRRDPLDKATVKP